MRHVAKFYDKNEFAFAARCHCHEEVQLGFGNIAILLDIKGFLYLKGQIDETQEKMKDCTVCPHQKNIAIDTSVKKMAFIFSYNEILKVQSVMQSTSLMLEVEGILGC